MSAPLPADPDFLAETEAFTWESSFAPWSFSCLSFAAKAAAPFFVPLPFAPEFWRAFKVLVRLSRAERATTAEALERERRLLRAEALPCFNNEGRRVDARARGDLREVFARERADEEEVAM